MKKQPATTLRTLLFGVMLFLLLPPGASHPTKALQRSRVVLQRGIENPKALDNFVDALLAVKLGNRVEPVRIMHFGDSHVAADVLTRAIRERFQEEFGDGGAGFIVPRNPMTTRRRGVSSGATDGWVIEGIGGRSTIDRIYGPAGIGLSTSSAGERAWVQTSCNHFEVYYVLQPGGGRIDIGVDGGSVLDEPLALVSRLPQVDCFSFDTPADGLHRLEVLTLGPGRVRLLGIVAEHITPGVSYDVLGINGARASRLLNWNQAAFAAAIEKRKPDLIILAYGTNDVADLDWTPVAYQRLLSQVLRRLRSAAPQASILVFAPPDRADLRLASNRMAAMVKAERNAALESGAAFWSAYDAMGGRGSMNTWVNQGLGQSDRVHLTTEGYMRLADRFYEDVRKIVVTHSHN